MGTDYEGLYARDYFGHQPGSTSFQPDFPRQLAAIARGLGCDGVLDVGSGSGELVRQLRVLDLAGVPLDFRGDEDAGVLPFDLTAHDPGQVARVRRDSSTRLPGTAHLATCLDVLEHIDRADLPAALENLHELAGEWLLVSVSTRPSSRDNLYHATVVPRRTWRRLFEAAGFEVVPHLAMGAMSYWIDYPSTEPFWCMTQWRRINPFGDSQGNEPYYLLLRKRVATLDRDAFATRAGAILCLPPDGPGSRPVLDPETHLTFLVGHYQDFHHYRPFWDAIDRRSVTVLVRSGQLRAIEPRRYRAILAYLKSHGLRYREVQSVRDVDWDDVPGKRRAFVVATESTILDTHLLNAAFVLAARGAGYRTFQLQHGIWPQAEFNEPLAFASEHVLTWSDEFRDGFAALAPTSGGQLLPKGLIGSTRFTRTGCAKFDDNGDSRPLTPADLLGDWAEAYDRSVLVATNLQWGMHQRGSEVVPALIGLAERRPDTLFLCKLHPVHDVDGLLLGDLPPNLKVLDEFACLAGDLQTPRLVRACDAVLCTPSTIAVEASLAGRPFAMIDTGNPNQFAGVEPVPISALDDEVGRLLAPESRTGMIARHDAFLDRYYDRSLLGRGLARVIEAIEADLSGPGPASPWADPNLVTARAFATSFSAQYLAGGRDRAAEVEGQLVEARDRIEALRGELAGESRRREAAEAELASARARLDAAVSELGSTRLRLDAAHDRLAPLSDLGPASIRVARGLRRLAMRHPRISGAVKALARRGDRHPGP